MEFKLDKPITDVKQDLLKRADFAKNVADAIIEIGKTGDCTVIGIQGEWGSGKTSVARMIEQSLGDKFNIVKLETWLATDNESLFREFFTCILDAVDADGKLHLCYDDIYNYANQYGRKFLRSINFNVGLFSTGASVDMSKIIDEPKPRTLESRKNSINEKLSEKDVKPIVFFIDDLDRLSYKEISSVFQLVKNIADFKKVTYVLCYDKNIVGKALDIVHVGKGYEYIEKVIQVPIDIPVPNKKLVRSYFTNLIDGIITNENEFSLQFDQSHWQGIFYDGVSEYLINLRVCNRLYNVFAFKFNKIGNECDFADLLAVTFLDLEAPKIINIIKANKTSLLGHNGLLSQDINEEIAKKLWEEIKNAASWDNREALKNIISNMFPLFAIKAGLKHGSWSVYPIKDTKKISDYRYFDRFFTLSLNDDEVSQVEVYDWINSDSDKHLDAWLNKWRNEGNLENALEEINNFIKSNNIDKYRICSLEGYLDVLKAFSMQRFNRASSRFFGVGEESYRDFIINNLLKELLKKYQNKEIITQVFTNEDISISVKCAVLVELSAGYDWCWGSDYLKNSQKLLNDEEFGQAQTLLTNCINDKNETPAFFEETNISQIFYIWNHIDNNGFKEYINTHQSKSYILRYVLVYVREGMVHASNEPSFKQWYFNTDYWPENLKFELAVNTVHDELANPSIDEYGLEQRIKFCAFLKFIEKIKQLESEDKMNLNLQLRIEQFRDVCEKYNVIVK